MCPAPGLGLPTEFSSAAVRAEAGDSVEGVASCAGRQGGSSSRIGKDGGAGRVRGRGRRRRRRSRHGITS